MMDAALDALIKGSAFLIGTALLAGMLRKASASVRYMNWAMGVLCAVAVPLASFVLPAMNVPLLEPPRPSPSVAAKAVAQPRIVNSSATSYQPVPDGTPASRGLPAGTWLALLWSAGALVVLIRSAMGFGAIRDFARGSRAVTDSGWIDLSSSIQRELKLRKPVALRIGGQGVPPMTWGIRKQTVLLPAVAAEWPADRLYNVLAHEMAHAKRNDGIMQLSTHVACAIYWFNPLVWYATYRMRIERESACDDRVLNLGAKPEDYADTLIEVAREVTSGVWNLAALPMARGSGFEKRVRAILDSNNNRKTLSRRSITAIALFAGVVTTLAASVHLVALPQPVASAQTAPKWAGVWKLNKEKSTWYNDPQTREMLDSIATITVTFEAIANGAKITSDAVGTRRDQKQHSEVAIPFNVRLDFKDLNLMASMLPLSPGTIMITSLPDDSLNMELTEIINGRAETFHMRAELSNGGNTLIESLVPPDALRVVFDRQ